MNHSKLRSHSAVCCLALLFAVWSSGYAQSTSDIQLAQSGQEPLKELSLEQLGKIEVTTATKTPETLWKTPAAIYVITQEDIRRSGVTSIPEALRLAPGVEVGRID